MVKKNKLLNESSEEDNHLLMDDVLVANDIAIMKEVILQFREEMDNSEDEEEVILILLHVSLIWPSTLLTLHPSIKVSVRLKNENEEEDIGSWERVIHPPEKKGWEQSLACLLHAVREVRIDYFVMESTDAPEHSQATIH